VQVANLKRQSLDQKETNLALNQPWRKSRVALLSHIFVENLHRSFDLISPAASATSHEASIEPAVSP
jgi:hypothetical protein